VVIPGAANRAAVIAARLMPRWLSRKLRPADIRPLREFRRGGAGADRRHHDAVGPCLLVERAVVIPGAANRAAVIAARLMPRWLSRKVAARLQRGSSHCR
jgi:hypothetical protein